MTLSQRVLGLFRRRETPDVETRTPGALQQWLTILGGEGESGGLASPYQKSVWVRQAIAHVARPVAMVDLEFYEAGSSSARGRRGSQAKIEDAELAAFWQRPARGSAPGSRLSRFDTIEATIGWLMLRGEFFWLLDDTWLVSGAKNKSPLIIARPDRMHPIQDGGELVGWRYLDAARRSHLLIPDQVVSSGFWNPDDELRGSAPMTAARMAAEADYAAGKFWKSLAESNGDRGETVIAPDGISDPQRDQIKEMLRRKRAAAKRGQYLPTFLVGNVKTEAPHIQSPDASAVTQRLQNRHEIYIAFGVPPSFCEVTASYSVGSASDRYKLIEETCQPVAVKIGEAVEAVCERLRGRAVQAYFRFDDHSTMQQVRAERLEAGRKMHERGVPWAVISDHLDLGLTPFAGWDKAWLPFNLQEIEANRGGAEDAEESAEKSGALDAMEELEVLLRGCPAHPAPGGPSSGLGLADLSPEDAKLCRERPRSGRGDLARTAQRTPSKLWEARMRTRAPYVKKIRGIVDRALYAARRETLANIAAAEAEERAVRSGAFDFLFDLERFLTLLVEPVFGVSVQAYQAAGSELLADDLGLSDPFISADPAGIEWLQARKNFIKDAGQEVWEEVRDSLEEGLEAGESFAKLADRVREKFNGMSKERGMRIAVTETGIAFESGRHDAMVQAGAEWKVWITSEDDRVRASHAALHETTVPIHEPFDVGGHELQYPCDPAGPAAEIISCRCIHGPAMGPDPADIQGNEDAEIPF